MEDAHSIVVPFGGVRGQGFFAIFDGHAGKQAAEWCGQNFAVVCYIPASYFTCSYYVVLVPPERHAKGQIHPNPGCAKPNFS